MGKQQHSLKVPQRRSTGAHGSGDGLQVGFFVRLTRLGLGGHKGMSTKGAVQRAFTPVLAVVFVPCDSGSKAVVPLGGGEPAELVKLLGFDGVAPVVVFTIFDVLDHVLLLLFLEAEVVDEVVSDSQVRPLLLDTNVVDLTSGSLVEDGVESTSNILNEDEGAGVLSITVDAQRHTSLETTDELGDELLGVLVRTIDVVTTSDDKRKLEGAEVGLGNELSGGLGGRVRVGGLEDHVLAVVVSLALSVHLVCADMDKPLHAAAVGSLEEDVGTQDVGLGEREGVTEGVVDMRLGSKMHNSVDLLGDDDVTDKVRRADVTLHELVVGVFLQIGNVLQRRTIIQTIEVDNVVIRVVLHQPSHNMGSNETGSTSDQNTLGGVDVVGHGCKREGEGQGRTRNSRKGVRRFCPPVATWACEEN